MDLMIFLALVAAWTGIKVKDDIAFSRADARYVQERARFNTWKSQVTNLDLERELKLFVQRPENYDKIYEEVNEVYDPIFEGRRLDELYPRSYWCKCRKGWTPQFHEMVQERICRLNSTRALRIMLAKQGFILSDDIFTSNSLCALPQLDRHVLFWCDRKLKELNAPVAIGFTETGALKWEMR